MSERPGVDNFVRALDVATQAKRGFLVGLLAAVGTYYLFVVSSGGSPYSTPYLLALALVLAFTVGLLATLAFTLGAAYRPRSLSARLILRSKPIVDGRAPSRRWRTTTSRRASPRRWAPTATVATGYRRRRRSSRACSRRSAGREVPGGHRFDVESTDHAEKRYSFTCDVGFAGEDCTTRLVVSREDGHVYARSGVEPPESGGLLSRVRGATTATTRSASTPTSQRNSPSAGRPWSTTAS